MGNNEAFGTFEHTIITLADFDALTVEILDELAEYWRNSDIDSGGQAYIETNDGRGLEQVCVNIIFPDFKETYVFKPGDEFDEERDEKETFNGVFYWQLCRERWGWR